MAARPVSRSSQAPHARHNSMSIAGDDEPKTAVRVAVRVRPPLDPADPSLELIPVRFRGNTCTVANNSSLTIESAQGKKLFVFDRVFNDQETQQGIWNYVSDSVNSFVQGYNVSILAYGQSGAGKSYTMGTAGPGDQSDQSPRGIIPRAAAALFENIHNEYGGKPTGSGIRPPSRYSGMPASSKPAESERNWQLKATYVEIYNEQLRDLLVADNVPLSERSTVAIREDTKGRILLTGLSQISINSVEDLINALNFGSSIRQTDATAINSKSSRSHAVFSLNLVQKKNKNTRGEGADHWVTMDSKLHFVDLAGSERLKNSGLSGERVKEGISINAGLASLGKVISQLSSKNGSGHVSYRDSRLTRLLQDSLGGNAITYMIACVNPVEFHLSETLNTVQYAQRARNIQSRPQVQQRAEDGDKQLIIDRLRSEVAFLRDQIRLSERGERRQNAARDREPRNTARENELQNQLLDAQENYSALSQRHAKLVAELAKSKEGGSDDVAMPALKNALENIAAERLDRSNNFAEAVEQVVLEYEKTIQSLESSLSNSRSALATSESNLLEREAKIVYLEAVAQQLQARVQKSMDREADSEHYLRDLEAKLEGISSGEGKYHIVIADLRKELQRIRESESSAEDYISTLEERLAEAEQDSDIMQREIKRLEHVIERQRGIGQFDKMMGQLDDVQQDAAPLAAGQAKSAHDDERGSDDFHDQLVATTTAPNPNGEVHVDAAEAEWKSFGPMEGEDDDAAAPAATADRAVSTPHNKNLNVPKAAHHQSPAQSKAIADKLETVTMELFDLRVDHESTVQELEDTSRKYEIALSTLAELQDAVDENRSPRPTSFLDRESIPGRSTGDYRLSSRLLASELSSVGRPPTLVDASTTSVTESNDSGEPRLPAKEESLADAVRRLKRANAEKDINMAELTENYAQLQAQHEGALNYIEELKEENAQKMVGQSQMKRFSMAVSRRGVSMYGGPKDNESKYLNQLRILGTEFLSGLPADTTKAFEQNLTAAIQESQTRSERVQQLEAELTAAKKEMDVKNTMISGLTRERSVRPSAAAGAMDIALIGQLRDHLSTSQKQIEDLQAASGMRQQKLQGHIKKLRTELKKSKALPKPDATGQGEGAAEVKAGAGETAADVDAAEAKATLEAKVKAEAKTEAGGDDDKADRDEFKDAAEEQEPAALGTDEDAAAQDDTKSIGGASLDKHIAELEAEHGSYMDEIQASQQLLMSSIVNLEASLQNSHSASSSSNNNNNHHNESTGASTPQAGEPRNKEAIDLEAEKTRHLNQVAALQKEIDGYKSTADAHASKLGQLESSYAQIIKEVEEDQKTRELTESELRTHRELVNNLEHQIEQQKTLAAFHQQGLKSVQDAHGKELEELRSTMAAQQAEHEARLQAQVTQHKQAQITLEEELKAAQVELATLLQDVSNVVGQEANKDIISTRIRSIADERRSLSAKNLAAAETLINAHQAAEEARKHAADLEIRVLELSALNDETLQELERQAAREKKSTGLVQDLERQINEFYDEHKALQQRLAATESERSTNDKTVTELRSKIAALETQQQQAAQQQQQQQPLNQRGSAHSQRDSLTPAEASSGSSHHQALHDRSVSASSRELKKQASHQSLPSPPPAVPLPPLPMLNGQPPPPSPATPRSPVLAEGFPSPPTSRHASRDISTVQFEDMESRLRQMEKHLAAERQLTATLEEALGDLETQANRTRADMEAWKKKCREVEEEASGLRKERGTMRNSLQAVEEERDRRIRAEQARRQLEERMEQLGKKQKKKQGTLNCF